MTLDELTDGPLRGSQQQVLIAKYCKGIEERIRIAEDSETAKRYVEESCSQFYQRCPSSIVRSFLSEYVHALYHQYWGIP